MLLKATIMILDLYDDHAIETKAESEGYRGWVASGLKFQGEYCKSKRNEIERGGE